MKKFSINIELNSNTRPVAAGDILGIGKDQLVLANYNDKSVFYTVMRKKNFIWYEVGRTSEFISPCITLCDVMGSVKEDIFISQEDKIYRYNWNGFELEETVYNSGFRIVSLSSGDINRDGNDELICIVENGMMNKIYTLAVFEVNNKINLLCQSGDYFTSSDYIICNGDIMGDGKYRVVVMKNSFSGKDNFYHLFIYKKNKLLPEQKFFVPEGMNGKFMPVKMASNRHLIGIHSMSSGKDNNYSMVFFKFINNSSHYDFQIIAELFTMDKRQDFIWCNFGGGYGILTGGALYKL